MNPNDKKTNTTPSNPISGFYIGTIIQNNGVNENANKLQVEIERLGTFGTAFWAPFLSTIEEEISNQKPPLGSQVNVSFINCEITMPVILGIVSNTKTNTTNTQLMKVQTDASQNNYTITTQSGKTISLNDTGNNITISDANSNSIVMSENGITIKTNKNISFQAEGTIELKGKAGINIASASGDIASTGVNIIHNASNNFNADGNASVNITGGADLTLKAAMININ